jgi:hypothetical protein
MQEATQVRDIQGGRRTSSEEMERGREARDEACRQPLERRRVPATACGLRTSSPSR